MNIKKLWLLGGTSALLLVAPTAWAKLPEEQISAQEVTNAASKPIALPEMARSIAPNSIAQNTQPNLSPAPTSSAQSPNNAQTIPPEGTGNRASESTTADLLTQIKQERNPNISPNRSMSQVTSVSELSDVQPTDWAFVALQSLVERYGCIEGYPDRTYRGNRALTRYEFAAGLNSCLEKMTELIQAVQTTPGQDQVKPEDLETIRRLQQEFRGELDTLRGRIDGLEARTTRLEAQKFTSSVTLLGGEAIFAISDAFGGNPPGRGETNPILTYLARVQTVTTFSGKDRLRLELTAGNFGGPVSSTVDANFLTENTGLGFASTGALNTNNAFLSFQSNTNNSIELSMLEYRFPAFNDRVVFTLRPVGFSLSTVLTANSPYFDAGRGAISRFAEAPPAFKIGDLDAGVGLDWLINRSLRFQLAYGSRNANDPGKGFLFGKDAYTAGAQLLFLPGNSVLTGLSLIYGYSPDGRLNTFTGSAIADASGFINRPSNIYAINGTIQWRLTRQFTFSAWGGLIATYADATNNGAISTNYLLSLGYSDPFGREGDLLAVMFGQPPKILNSKDIPFVDIDLGDFATTSLSTGLGEDGTSHHFEAFYRYTVNDRISITPGFFIVTQPGNIKDNDTIFVGTIRTTFRF